MVPLEQAAQACLLDGDPREQEVRRVGADGNRSDTVEVVFRRLEKLVSEAVSTMTGGQEQQPDVAIDTVVVAYDGDHRRPWRVPYDRSLVRGEKGAAQLVGRWRRGHGGGAQ